MKTSFTKVLQAGEWVARLFVSRTEIVRRALWPSEWSEREAHEADRLDRLRNPHDYRGRGLRPRGVAWGEHPIAPASGPGEKSRHDV